MPRMTTIAEVGMSVVHTSDTVKQVRLTAGAAADGDFALQFRRVDGL